MCRRTLAVLITSYTYMEVYAGITNDLKAVRVIEPEVTLGTLDHMRAVSHITKFRA